MIGNWTILHEAFFSCAVTVDVFYASVLYAVLGHFFDDQDATLLAPVRITMAASVAAAQHSSAIPSCSFYNEGVGAWDAAGLAIESMTVLSSGDGEGRDVNLTCLTFHLSDFTVSADELEAAFRPVSLVRERFHAPAR